MHHARVEVTVGKRWQTDEWTVSWQVVLPDGTVAASGREAYGPLWEAHQVEAMVAQHVTALMATWMREPSTA